MICDGLQHTETCSEEPPIIPVNLNGNEIHKLRAAGWQLPSRKIISSPKVEIVIQEDKTSFLPTIIEESKENDN